MSLDAVGGGASSGALNSNGNVADPTVRGAGATSSLNDVVHAARSGSTVEQGTALRTLDGATGDARISNALVRGEADAAPAGADRAAETCTIEVRYKPVVGPTHHAFIVTTDSNSTNFFRGGPQANDTGVNSPSASSSGDAERPAYDPQFGVYGPIVTEYGAYRDGTVDWTTQPSGQQTVARTPESCDRIESEFARHMDDIEAAQINYMPLHANSNSTVRETLERAGFDNVSPVVWAPAWGSQLPGPR